MFTSYHPLRWWASGISGLRHNIVELIADKVTPLNSDTRTPFKATTGCWLPSNPSAYHRKWSTDIYTCIYMLTMIGNINNYMYVNI